MTLTIDLPPESERSLCERATRGGVTPVEVARDLIERGLAQPASGGDESNPNQSTLDLLARWAAEDAADPADPAEAEREWHEFRDAMNAHSTRGQPIYP